MRGPGGIASQESLLLACVHCGFCLPACPTYRVLGDEADSPRGRLHLMRALAEGRISAEDRDLRMHLDRCLGCRACEPVCPSGVRYGELLEHARHDLARVRPPGWSTRLLLAVFGRRAWSRAAGWKARGVRATGLPGLLARGLSGGWFRTVRVGMAMLAASGPWPGLKQGAGRAAGAPAGAAPRPSGLRVGVLRGCVQQGLFSRVGEAARRTLAANGYQVIDVADAGCCGALHAHAGGLEEARAAARRQVASFEAAGVDRVAVDAAGCGAAMKGYGALLKDDPDWRERAAAFAVRVRDVTELLADAGPRRGGTVELSAAYDPPCHLLHGQGVDEPVHAVLEAVPGLEVRPVPNGDRCCGGAGIYGLTQGALADTIAQEKVAAVLSTGADVVLTGNPGCMMQIGGGLLLADADMGVVHPVELLDESYRRGGIYGPGPGSQGAGLP